MSKSFGEKTFESSLFSVVGALFIWGFAVVPTGLWFCFDDWLASITVEQVGQMSFGQAYAFSMVWIWLIHRPVFHRIEKE